MKKYLAELTGTFALVFCGTGSVIVNQETGGQIGQIGIAICFGLIVTAMIFTFGNISGAHINPAVTLGFTFAGLFPKKEILPFILSQLSGAFLASGALRLLFPGNSDLGRTSPAGTEMQSFFLELILTFILMLVILFTSQNSKEKGIMAGIAVGSVVLVEALFAGPISGASMNPARSLAPAIVSGNLSGLWIYLTAPLLGAVLATFVWSKIRSGHKTL